MTLSPSDQAKKAAADAAVAFVQDGMRLGLGTGSTAAFMVRRLGERVRDEGLRVVGVPTSLRTADLARAQGIRVVTLDQARWLDVTIDGADEFDGDLALIKGGGGAHLQEKVVAAASDKMIVITDPAKRVARLGVFPTAGRGSAFRPGLQPDPYRAGPCRSGLRDARHHAQDGGRQALRHRRGQRDP